MEQRLAECVPSDFEVICVNSCTSALDLAFELLELRNGDAVITTPMTCIATNISLVRRGCKILWADCDPNTGHIQPESVARLADGDVKAIVAVDWAGEVADYAALRQLGIPVVQDAAHSMSPHADVCPAQDSGDLICWSFQATKHLTTGDGGALLVRDSDLAERARLLRWYGLDRSIPPQTRSLQNLHIAGFKYHMNDMSAALGIANLYDLRERVNSAQLHATCLDEYLTPIGAAFAPTRPSSRWMYSALIDNQRAFTETMSRNGIETSKVHRRNDTYQLFSDFKAKLPGLDRFAARNVSIPVGYWLTKSSLQRILDALGQYFDEHEHDRRNTCG